METAEALAVVKKKRRSTFPTPKEWGGFFDETLLFLGTGLCLAGVIFFFAFNWSSFPKWGKFGLLQGAIGVLLGVALWRGLESLAGQVAVTAASVFVGVFLAVFGQVYQTGADPYQLFLGWSALIAAFVFVARFPVLWFLWLLLIHAAILLMALQVWGYEPFRPRIVVILLAVNGGFLWAWEVLQEKAAWMKAEGRWLERALGGGLAFLLTFLWILLRVASREEITDPLLPVPVLFAVGMGGAGFLLWFYGWKKLDLLILCFLAFGGIGVTSTYLAKAMHWGDGVVAFLILTVVVLVQSALVVKFLRWRQRLEVERLKAKAEEVKTSEGPKTREAPPSEVPKEGDAKLSGLVSKSQVLRAITQGHRAFGGAGAGAGEEAGAGAGAKQPAQGLEESHVEEEEEEEADPNATPWYIQAFVGASAWFACLFLMGFFAAFLRFKRSEEFLILGGLLLVAGAVGLYMSRGIFWEQAALVIHLTGHLLFWFGIADALRNPRSAGLVVALVEVGIVIGIRHSVVRFFGTIAAAGAGLTALFPFWTYLQKKNIPWWIPEAYLLVLLGGLVVLWVAWAGKTEEKAKSETAGGGWEGWALESFQAPVGWGIALFQMGVIALTVFREFRPRPGAMMTIAVGLLGGVTAVLITRRQRVILSGGLWAVLIFFLAALSGVTLFSPGILLALLFLVIGFYNRALIRMGAASIFLVLFVVKFYYDLEMILLHKSYILLGSGVLLFGLRLVIGFLGRDEGTSPVGEVRHA